MKYVEVTHGHRAGVHAIAVLDNNPNGMRADQYEALLLAMLAADGHANPSVVLAAVRERGLQGYPHGSRPPSLLQPILIARAPIGWTPEQEKLKYVLIDGEHRLRAAKELCADTVSAVLVEGYSLADVRAARIGLNHLRGEQSYSATAAELRAIAADNDQALDELHRAIVGYTERDLSVLLAATANTPVEILGAAEEDETPKPERPATPAPPTLTIKFASQEDRRAVQAWLKSLSDDPGAALVALAEKAQRNGKRKSAKNKNND